MIAAKIGYFHFEGVIAAKIGYFHFEGVSIG